MMSKELSIGGMSCQHCVMHVRKALQMIDGIEVEDVEIGKARLWVDEQKVDPVFVAKKLEEEGYQLLGMQ